MMSRPPDKTFADIVVRITFKLKGHTWALDTHQMTVQQTLGYWREWCLEADLSRHSAC